MIKSFENENKVLMENAYFAEKNFYLNGYFGLTYFEIGDAPENGFILYNKEDFLALYNLMTEMKKEIDRLDNL